MPSIVFTTRDIARIRMVEEPMFRAEVLLALDLLDHPGRGGAAFAPWRRQVQRRLGRTARPPLGRPHRPLAEMYRLLCAPAADNHGLRAPVAGAGEDERARRAIQEFSAVALTPYRRRIVDRLRADRDTRARILLTGGIEHLFGSLHPAIRWVPPVLEVPCGDPRRIELDGRGLRLAPSIFLRGRPGLFLDPLPNRETPTLLYPIPAEPEATESLWRHEAGPRRALGALVGQTRAAALRALRVSSSTSELGDRLGVSNAAASQHTSVLRDAGLITTRRRRNTVVHSLTPLGAALLAVDGDQDESLAQASN